MAFNAKLTNMRKALGDVKTRAFLAIMFIIVVITLFIAYFKYQQSAKPPEGFASAVSGVPIISSIPGLGQPSREYAKLQEQQNQQLAQEAERRGTAAIPTVVRTTYLDSGVSSDLTKQSGATSVAGCGVEELRRARAAGVNAAELRCRGCSLEALKAAGYTAGELRAAGYSAAELKAAGFSAVELKNAGFNAKELAAAGFAAKELLAAGYTPGELKDAGFSGTADPALAGGCYSSANTLDSGDCSVEKLRAVRVKGANAADLRKIKCSAAVLRLAGYTAKELKDAGFCAKELRDAGYSATELRAAGFSATDLHAAGFSAQELKDAGFSAKDLKDAGYSAGELKNAGFTAAELRAAGFSAKDLKNAGYSANELKDAGFSTDELKAAGYSAGDLLRAGIAVTAEGGAGVCKVENLKKAKANGISAAALKEQGCSAAVLRAAGFTAQDLKAAGFSNDEIKAANFSPDELKNAGIIVNATTNICSIENIKKAKSSGLSVAAIKNQGCSAEALRAAGFDARDLLAAGYSPDELLSAGFNPDEIRAQQAVNVATKGTADSMTVWRQELDRVRKEQQQKMSAQELEDFRRQQQTLMVGQANQLFSAWTPVPSQQYVVGAVTEKGEGANATTTAQAAAAQNVDVYKAGTIIFAILDTEVNTDENSPIMASIISGPLKGAKVLGNFSRIDKKALLQFNVLSIPRLTNSIGISAVAVDPNTAKIALASNVDSHYLLRYGTLFGSSFLSGLASAMQNAGAQTTNTIAGSVTTFPPLNTEQKAIVALGNVGQQFGSAMAPTFGTPPTVRVNAGTSIGLLLMADLSVPKN